MLREFADHRLPTWRRVAGGLVEAIGVEAAVADELVIRLDDALPAKFFTAQLQQTELGNRLAGDVPHARKRGVLGEDSIDDPRHFERSKTTVNCFGEAAYGLAALAQKPIQQRQVGGELVADHRGAEGGGVGVSDFALMLRLAVKICGIRRVALCVISLRAGEDAVGAEVNQPRTGFAAALGQEVWKLGVDAQGERLITGFVALLDKADTIDDGLGLRLAKHTPKRFVVGDIIELDIPARKLELHVEEDELNRRKKAWVPPKKRFKRGFGAIYANHITQADVGCDFDVLEGTEATADPEIH